MTQFPSDEELMLVLETVSKLDENDERKQDEEKSSGSK